MEDEVGHGWNFLTTTLNTPLAGSLASPPAGPLLENLTVTTSLDAHAINDPLTTWEAAGTAKSTGSPLAAPMTVMLRSALVWMMVDGKSNVPVPTNARAVPGIPIHPLLK